MNIDDIQIGYKLPVKKSMNNSLTFQKGEVLGIRTTPTSKQFYIHYIDFNKRLDEWVDQKLLKIDTFSEIETPKKKKKTEEIVAPQREKVKDEEIYKIKNVKRIQIGDSLIDAWYFSPYPDSVATADVVYICEFCLFYFKSEVFLIKHSLKCELRHPPGNEIYRCNELSFFELDGHIQKNYCRNLCLLSKLFLDHKTLFYDIDVFMFYVLCKHTETGYKIVGYFSKEKISEHGYNLACILTLPHQQRKGYGKVLMDFSYLLSRREGKIASPEKPLSDLGLLGYRSYWTETVVGVLRHNKKMSIKELSVATSITEEDIVGALASSGILHYYNGNPIYLLSESSVEKSIKAEKYRVKKECLKWRPCD